MPRLDPPPPDRQLTEDDRARLAAIGRTRIASIVHTRRIDDAALRTIELPDGLGVAVVHEIRGGATVFVAPDGTALVTGSAMDFDAGLMSFRTGSRTPDTS